MNRSVGVGVGVLALVALGWSLFMTGESPPPETPTIEQGAAPPTAAAPTTAARRLKAPERSPPAPRPSQLPAEMWSKARQINAMPIGGSDEDAFDASVVARMDALEPVEEALRELTRSDDPQTATEAHLLITTLYEEFGYAWTEAPLPDDLPEDRTATFSSTMDHKAYNWFRRAQRQAGKAIETADSFPPGHAVHAAITHRIDGLAQVAKPARPPRR